MKRKTIPLLVTVILIVAAVVTAVAIRNRSADSSSAITVSGNIEVIDAEVSFKIPGRVVERSVDEGDTVTSGQLIARLEDSDLKQEVGVAASQLRAAEAALAELEAGSRPEEIAAARAGADRAQASLDQLLAGSRPQEIAAASAAVAAAAADAANLKAEFDRQKALYETRTISSSAFDAARAASDAAGARLDQAREQLKLVQEGPRREEIDQARAAATQAKEEYSLVEKGPRAETIDSARARVQQGRDALALAETRLGYAAVNSPLAGVVLSKNIEPGEYVAAGTPVVTVGDLENVFLRAYVNETDLGRVKLGQRVIVTTDTYPGKTYEGRISFIGSQAEFTPKNVQTPKERVKLVYRIKVDLKNPDMELKAGMPADAAVVIDEKAP